MVGVLDTLKCKWKLEHGQDIFIHVSRSFGSKERAALGRLNRKGDLDVREDDLLYGGVVGKVTVENPEIVLGAVRDERYYAHIVTKAMRLPFHEINGAQRIFYIENPYTAQELTTGKPFVLKFRKVEE